MKRLKTIEKKLYQKTISFGGLNNVYKRLRGSSRILLQPNEHNRERLIEIIRLYDKTANNFQGNYNEWTEDEIATRLFAYNNIEFTGKIRVEGRPMGSPFEKDVYKLCNIVFLYNKAVNNPKEMAIADSMYRIWQSQNYTEDMNLYRSIINPLIKKYYA